MQPYTMIYELQGHQSPSQDTPIADTARQPNFHYYMASSEFYCMVVDRQQFPHVRLAKLVEGIEKLWHRGVSGEQANKCIELVKHV